jgi:hypothetical protein
LNVRGYKLIFLLAIMMLCLSACNLAAGTNTAVTPTADSEKPAPPEGGGIPAGTPIASTCSVRTTGESEMRDAPGIWGQLIATQGAGMTMPVLAVSSNGWYKVPFGGDGPGMMEAWIPSNQLVVEGDCDSLERVELTVPLTDCKVTNNTGGSQILHATPELLDGNLLGYFPAGETFPVIKREGSWYMVFVDALSSGAWVEGRLVTPSAECSSI